MKAKVWRFLEDAGAIPMAAALLVVFGISWAWWAARHWIPSSKKRNATERRIGNMKKVILLQVILLLFVSISIMVTEASAGKWDPNSIVDTLKQRGMENSFAARRELWKDAGMEGMYTGSAFQNRVLIEVYFWERTWFRHHHHYHHLYYPYYPY